MMPSAHTVRRMIAVILFAWTIFAVTVHYDMIITASQVEMLQLVVASVGLGVAVWGLWTATKDAMTTARDEPRRILAVGHVRTQILRIASHMLLVYGGLASVSMPPPPPLFEPDQAVIIRMVMVGVTLLLSLDYSLDRRDRFLFINHPWFRNPPPQGAS